MVGYLQRRRGFWPCRLLIWGFLQAAGIVFEEWQSYRDPAGESGFAVDWAESGAGWADGS